MTHNKQVNPENGQVTYGSSDASSSSVIPQSKIGLTWGVLNQKHDCYDSTKNQKLNLLLKGGFEIVENAELFIEKWNNESQLAYEDRLKCATYENNFGEIINDFGTALFSKPLMVVPSTDASDSTTLGEEPDPSSKWMKLQRRFDLQGRTLATFMKEIQESSNATGKAYFGMDYDEDGTPYAYQIDINSVLDYEKDEAGNFIFIIFRDDTCQRTSANQVRNLITSTFVSWTKDKDVIYDIYQITYPKNKEPSDDTIVPFIESLPVDFINIPIIEAETPPSLCVGNVIGQLAASSFCRYTSFLHSLNRASKPILNYKQSPELPGNGDLSELTEDTDRGINGLRSATSSGTVISASTDNLEWVEINGSALTVFQEQLQTDKNEMYRLVAQLGNIIGVKNQSSGGDLSGLAKQMDSMNKEAMLNAYAHLVKEWTLKAFDLIFAANDNDVQLQCKGMDNYQVIDPDVLQTRIQNIPIYRANVPSSTSLKQVLVDISAQMHPFTNPTTLNKIQQELFDAVDKMDLHSLHQSQIDNEINEKTNKSNISSSPVGNSSTSSNSSVEAPQKQIGDSGNVTQEVGSHLQTSDNTDPMTIYNQLVKDYKPEDLSWVKVATWKGPTEVQLSDISLQDLSNWTASQPGPNGQDKVDKFAEIMQSTGFDTLNPIILSNTPHNNEKYVVIDGRHRLLAAKAAGINPVAYIANVGSNDKTTDHMQMHSKQTTGTS